MLTVTNIYTDLNTAKTRPYESCPLQKTVYINCIQKNCVDFGNSNYYNIIIYNYIIEYNFVFQKNRDYVS